MLRRLIVLVLIASLLPSWSAAAQIPARTEVTFAFTDAVSAVDRVSIEEGIRFAQDAFIDLFGSDVDNPVTVDDDETGQAPHGVRSERQIFINAWNYRGMSAVVQTMSVVHEYFHVWQGGQSGLALGGDPQLGPNWMIEGSAEFVAFWTLAEADLVSYEDVHEFFIQMANGAHAQEPVNLPALSELTDYNGMFAPGAACCSYHLSALAIEMLVHEGGVEALGTYCAGLMERDDHGGGWQGVFEYAFGQSPALFYESFEAQRASILVPTGRDVTVLLQTPPFNEGAAEVTLDAVPKSVERGEQAILTGETAAGTLCSLAVTSVQGNEPLAYPTYADSDGFVFWLWTVEESVDPGTATIEVACGGMPIGTSIEVTWIFPSDTSPMSALA